MPRNTAMRVAGEKVEIVRRGLAAFNARDIDRLIETFGPEIELHSAFADAMSGDTVYHGHEGLRRWWRDLEETWEEIRLEPEKFFERGDHVVAYYLMRGRGRQSGVEVAMPVAHLIRFSEGLAVSLTPYADREDALRELGVAEDALEPFDP